MKEKYELYRKICEVVGLIPMTETQYISMCRKQYNKGLSKYGTTLENANLNEAQLNQHANEEIVDLIEYCSQLDKI